MRDSNAFLVFKGLTSVNLNNNNEERVESWIASTEKLWCAIISWVNEKLTHIWIYDAFQLHSLAPLKHIHSSERNGQLRNAKRGKHFKWNNFNWIFARNWEIFEIDFCLKQKTNFANTTKVVKFYAFLTNRTNIHLFVVIVLFCFIHFLLWWWWKWEKKKTNNKQLNTTSSQSAT